MGTGRNLTTSDGKLYNDHLPLQATLRLRKIVLRLTNGHLTRAATIRTDLSPGEHTLTCELLKETADPSGGKEFRLISVMR